MEEINLVKEIERLEALYKHYKRFYRRVRFLCCSDQSFFLLNSKKTIIKIFFKKQERRGFKKVFNPMQKVDLSYHSSDLSSDISFHIFS